MLCFSQMHEAMKPSGLGESVFLTVRDALLSCGQLSSLPALPRLTCVVFRVGLPQDNPVMELISLALLPSFSRACLGLTQEPVGLGDLGLYFPAMFQYG